MPKIFANILNRNQKKEPVRLLLLVTQLTPTPFVVVLCQRLIGDSHRYVLPLAHLRTRDKKRNLQTLHQPR